MYTMQRNYLQSFPEVCRLADILKKVSALVHLLDTGSIKSTFENVCLVSGVEVRLACVVRMQQHAHLYA